MTEVDDFARLRPPVDRLDETTRASLRAALFEPTNEVRSAQPAAAPPAAAGPSAVADPADLRPLTGRPPRRVARSKRMPAVAAAAAVLAIVGGMAAVREATRPSSTALQTGGAGPVSSDTASLSPTPLPLLRIVDLPGWSLSYASIRHEPGDSLVLARPDQGINGPMAKVERSGDGTSVYGDTSVDVTVNGERGVLSGMGDVRYLSWTTAGGDQLGIMAFQLDESTLLDLAEAVEIDEAGQLTIGQPVAGLVPVDQASATAMRTRGSFTFSNGDGRELQVSIYAGGSFLHALRLGAEQREQVSFHGQTVSLLDYGPGSGRYRVNYVEGFWAWELDGEPYADYQAFLDVIDHLAPVDQETWNRSLPVWLIGPPQRPAAIAEMLADLPIPTRLDLDALVNQPVTDRREAVAAEVAGAVGCAWLDTWIAADRNGDRPSAQTAAEAIQAVGQSALVGQAGLYADGVPDQAATLSAHLSALTEGSVARSAGDDPGELRAMWPCSASSA